MRPLGGLEATWPLRDSRSSLPFQVLGHMRADAQGRDPLASLGTPQRRENVWSEQEPWCLERPLEPLGLVKVTHVEPRFSRSFNFAISLACV